MLLIALALATMPKPVGRAIERDLTSFAELLSDTRAASTRVDLGVDTAGQPVRCDVSLSEGVRALDRAACAYLMRRARFMPARDADGAPVAAVIRVYFTLNQTASSRGGTRDQPSSQPVDFAVPVSNLPRSTGVFVADVMLMTDAMGHVVTCDVATSSHQAQLDRLACAQMLKTGFAPARDATGTAVKALRQVGVGFVAAAPAPF